MTGSLVTQRELIEEKGKEEESQGIEGFPRKIPLLPSVGHGNAPDHPCSRQG